MKGPLMEELLRQYFLNRGFFVIRGAKFKYDTYDITDIDLWLYNKSSAIGREKIIVDIKNKKTPQAIERIFWTKGLMLALRANSCIVATTERRESIRHFGKLNNVTVLDGHFLSELKELTKDRLSEEDLYSLLRIDGDSELINEYHKKFEIAKSLMIANLDFSSANILLNELKFFFEECFVNPKRRVEAYRMLLMTISYLLINLDFILRDLVFLVTEERSKKIDEGFKFGNLGKEGIERTLDLAINLTNQSTAIKNKYLQQYETLPVQILREYFSKIDNSNNLVQIAKSLENIAYSKKVVYPNNLDVAQKSILFLFLDYHGFDRKKFIGEFASY